MNRRVFLRNAAGAAAMAGGGIWYSWQSGVFGAEEGSAYAAWRMQNGDREPRLLRLVRAAILASSPHNTQPWRFRIGTNFVELYLERNRSVAGLDPYLREAHIGMGCALENLCLAAAAQGYNSRVSIIRGKLDSGAEAPLQLIARVEVVPGQPQEDELYRAIPHRHTNRNPYDPEQPLPAGFVAQLSEVCSSEDVRVFLFEEVAQRNRLAHLSAAANLELYSDQAVETGSERWIRWRASDAERYKDGLTIDNFGLSPVAAAAAKLAPEWLLKRMAAPSERSKMYESQMQSARLIGIIAVRDRIGRTVLVCYRLTHRMKPSSPSG